MPSSAKGKSLYTKIDKNGKSKAQCYSCWKKEGLEGKEHGKVKGGKNTIDLS